ncbi:MAG TPA: hypothetical protein VJ604_10860, partial [Geomonas sp.]|nr:hypothetical protein [Geomonas sp.]
MCLIREVLNHSISRRTFLKGVGTTLISAPLLAGPAATVSAAASPGVVIRPGAGNFHTKVVLLGTAGGPQWWPGSTRASAATALVVGETIYLIDLGHGSAQRMAEAFNSGIFVNTAGGKVDQSVSPFLRNADALFF